MKAAGNAVGDAEKSAAATSKAVRGAGDITERVAEVFQSHPSSRLIILLCAMLLILMGSMQSCTPLAQSVLESLIIGTYPATEDDVRAAERAYAAKERELQDEMDRYEQYHPGYDEYHVDADEIWHDPYHRRPWFSPFDRLFFTGLFLHFFMLSTRPGILDQYSSKCYTFYV